MFKHVLIATDGTRRSTKMAGQAIRLARRLGARATGVHVYPAHIGIEYDGFGVIDARTRNRLRKLARSEGRACLDRLSALAKSQRVTLEPVLLEHDNPWKGIIATAKKRRCDLIVMAAHGRGTLAALVLGSETNKVLVHSKIPVLVYR